MAYIVENFNPSTANASSSLMTAAPLFHEGVEDLESGSMEITANGTNLTLTMAAGACYVKNDAWAIGNSQTEFWKVRSDSTDTVTLDAADATNDRIDLVGIQIDDSAANSVRGVDAVDLEFVKGTPAASPTEPTAPDDFIVLAVVTVPASATSVNSGNVEDRRLSAVPIIDNGGWITQQRLSPTYQAEDSPSFTMRFENQDVRHLLYKGTKVRVVQGGTTKYFIVTADPTFSTHTDVNLYGGTDYTLTTDTITDFAVAYGRTANGFPMNPDKWSVVQIDTTLQGQGSVTTNQWYSIDTTNLALDVPVGVWELGYDVIAGADSNSVTLQAIQATLSTSQNGESDNNLSSYWFQEVGTSGNLDSDHQLTKDGVYVDLAAKDTYYLNLRTTTSVGTGSIRFRGDVVGTRIFARCALL